MNDETLLEFPCDFPINDMGLEQARTATVMRAAARNDFISAICFVHDDETF